jgi:coenzyme F420-0:L-glutamate ligase/coenzyme F420-1:gamma-L-glutamate ligase
MFSVFALEGIPEIVAGEDLGLIIGDAIAAGVSAGGEPGAAGPTTATLHHGDIVTDETVRVVATRAYPGGVTRIVENRLGIVGAAAGVDGSNTPEGTVLLLPLDPDASAALIRATLESRFEVALGVVITDTLGRTWREGQTDVAIGGSGVMLLEDLRGTLDTQGRRLDVTLPAVGDEIAAAADLVKRKSAGLPVAIVRGLGHLLSADAAGGRVLIRPSANDMFRLGTQEAYDEGFAAGRGA